MLQTTRDESENKYFRIFLEKKKPSVFQKEKPKLFIS